MKKIEGNITINLNDFKLMEESLNIKNDLYNCFKFKNLAKTDDKIRIYLDIYKLEDLINKFYPQDSKIEIIIKEK